MSDNRPDYRKLGLKCGIEIHQQLDTDHKLFCSCSSRFSEGRPELTISRRMRAVAGELGEVDTAALHELLRGKIFDYNIYSDEDCLVETDSEPPHELNRKALETALEISILLKCDIPGEVHVMRKTVIDGSNTSGFQRTLITGLDGNIKTGKGLVGITNVCLEEDAAQIIDRGQDITVYGLDRLGIPLVEIGTASDIRTPEEAMDVAKQLGMLLRSTKKVKRGIGTIRQDINVSIRKGDRVEIKGAQELRLVPKLVQNEAERQASLAAIRTELEELGFRKVKMELKHVSRHFRASESKIMAGKTVFAVRIPGFAGFLARQLTATRTLGNELANYVKVRAGIPGIIHSDENLQKYRLESEFEKLGKEFKAKEGDTIIILSADRNIAQRTAKALEERINQLLDGVPREVRKALPDGDTEFLRPLPGAARMYPETDVPPIKINTEMLSRIQKNLPESWDRKMSRLSRSYRVPSELASQIVHSGMDDMFERLAKKHDPKLVSTTLLSTMKELGREGCDTSRITEGHLDSLFRLYKSGKIAKEAVQGILRKTCEKPDSRIDEIVKNMGVKGMDVDELEDIVRKLLASKKDLLKHPRREKILMGLVMKEVRGRIDGKTVMGVLSRELKKIK